MANSILKNILREYELNRNNALSLASQKKQEIYDKEPRLKDIDFELASFAMAISREMLKSNDKSLLNTLEKKRQELNLEKEKIYQKLNISSDYFLPQFKCSICKDTGFISSGNTSQMCSCLKQKLLDIEYNKSNMFDLKNQCFDNFNPSLFSNTINKERYNANVSPKENIEIIKKICLNFVNNFDNPETKNLLFTGNTGLGKTFLSNCIANEVLKKGKTVMYQTAPLMLDYIIDEKMKKNRNSDSSLLENILSTDLLIIDDLGTEGINNMKFSELFTILNSRLLNQNKKATKTIISTNLGIKNLAQVYGERIVSRIIGNYNICYFFGEDLRIKNNH